MARSYRTFRTSPNASANALVAYGYDGQARGAQGAAGPAWGPAMRPRRRTFWTLLAALSPPLDGLYGFCLFAAMLFVQQLGSLAGLLIAILPIGYAVMRRRSYFQALRSNLILFAFPVFAIVSTIWSESPAASARYGAELLLTVAGAIVLVAARREAALLKGILCAFILYGLGSMAFGHSVGVGVGDGGTAFVGLGDGKNMMADISSIGLIVAITVLALSIARRTWGWGVISLGAVALELYLVFAARSAGAILGLFGALVSVVLVLVACGAPRYVRMGLVAVLTISAGIFAAMFKDLVQVLLNIGVSLFDKDATLTGRTYLWYRANDLIAEKPFLGRGFSAFWQQGNPDAEGLWQYAGILNRSGFNFHNTPTEIVVEVGYVGLAIFLAMVLLGLFGLIRHYVNRPSLTLCFWFGLTAYFLIRAPFEAFGTAAFYYSTALIFAAIGVAMQPAPAPLRIRAVRRLPMARPGTRTRPTGMQPRWGMAR